MKPLSLKEESLARAERLATSRILRQARNRRAYEKRKIRNA